MHTARIDKATSRALAVKAQCDPRTIERAARGEPVRGLPGHRARAVLADVGLLPAPPDAASRAAAGST
jgi:hypothetical protein